MENSRYWDHLYLFLEISLTLLFSEYWFKMLSHLVRSWTECRCHCRYCYLQCQQDSNHWSDFCCLRWDLSYQREFFSVFLLQHQLSAPCHTERVSPGGRALAPSPGKTMTACCLLLTGGRTGGRGSSLLPRSSLSLSIWMPRPQSCGFLPSLCLLRMVANANL